MSKIKHNEQLCDSVCIDIDFLDKNFINMFVIDIDKIIEKLMEIDEQFEKQYMHPWFIDIIVSNYSLEVFSSFLKYILNNKNIFVEKIFDHVVRGIRKHYPEHNIH